MTIREPEPPASKENRKPLRVLLIEDSPPDAEIVLRELKKAGFEVSADVVQTPEEFTECLRSKTYDVVLADYNLPSWTGMDALAVLHQQEKDIPFILVTGSLGDEAAVDCIKQGASDYVLKDRLGRLQMAVRSALEERILDEERKRAGKEKVHLAAILDATTDLVAMADLHANISYCNKGGRKMLGIGTDEDMLGTQVVQYQPEWARKLVLEEGIPTAIRDGEWRGDTAFLTRTGREIPVSQVILAHKAPDGTVQFLSTIARDIAERKRMKALHALELQAIEQSADAIVITDSDGTIQYINPAFTSISGYDRQEALGQKPRILKSGMRDRTFYQNLWDTVKAGLVWEGELVNRRKDGTLYTQYMTIAPVRDPQGVITNFVAIQHDVTEHRRLQAQFHQAQKMEGIGRLAGGVAHDFNNHLGVIIGYSELLLECLGADDPLRKNVGMIKEAALRSASLTRQLLAFSRRQVIEPTVLDLNASVSELGKMFRPLIGEDIEVVTLLDPALGKVGADPSQIDQIIMNLAVNSRDAMPQGGRLTIETANVELDESYARTHASVQPGPYVMLTVSDTGTGMDTETLSNIFEPFFTTKEKAKGTGLGLAMVYGIVKQSGGSIWVYSEPGQGTTFKIYLPRLEAGIRVDEVKRVSPSSLKGEETVLVVEDEEMLRHLSYEFLQSGGYTVLEAGNGAEAVEISNRHQGLIHLLMTDVVMPGMSGRELAKRLHDSRPDMRVLYVSGYTDDAILRNGALESGMPFLQKPFTRDSLMCKVRDVLEGAARSDRA